MYSAAYVDRVIADVRAQMAAGKMTKSLACWTVGCSCEGQPYVFGAWGELCTTGERRKRYSYRKVENILAACQQLREKDQKNTCSGCKFYPGGERTRCWDCRGFGRWVPYATLGFALIGEGATSQWNTASNWCAKGEAKDGIPQGVLVHLFIWSDETKTMKHTGMYYCGDTCECSSGVQVFRPMKRNRWTHWAVAACFADEMGMVPVSGGENDKEVLPTLKKGNKGEKVRELQDRLMALGYDLPKYGADGSFGKETQTALKAFQKDNGLTANGVCDADTWAALLAERKRVTVVIPGVLEATARQLLEKYSGAYIKEGE